MYKFSFFVPPEYAENVKQAVFDAGAGKVGNYSECSWESLGTGQYRPLSDSQPFKGECHKLEHVQELKVEMVCLESLMQEVIKVFKQVHPYEEPAYEVIKLCDF